MRKNRIYYIMLSMFALTLLLSACTEDFDSIDQTKLNGRTLVATSVSDATTRTALDNNGVSVNWSEDDAISVFNTIQQNNLPFTLSKGAGSNIGYFEGTSQISENSKHIAVYPYSENYAVSSMSTDADGIHAVVSGIKVACCQFAVKDGFDPRYNVMTAYTEDLKLRFKQVVCYVEIETNEPCYAINFTANGGEKITGNVSVTIGSDGVASASQGEYSWVQLVNPDGSLIQPGIYHIAILPQVLSSGFTVECYKSDKVNMRVRTYSKSTSIFGRDKIVSLGKTQGWQERKCHECDHYYAYGAGNQEYVDLGLPSGLKWAACNLGANTPLEYGDYYAWGAVEPWAMSYDIDKTEIRQISFTWPSSSDIPAEYADLIYKPQMACIWHNDHKSYDNNNAPYYGGNSLWKKYVFNNNSQVYPGTSDHDKGLYILESTDDAATYQWGSGWRMPTFWEIDELTQNTTLEHIPNYENTGIDVYKFTSKINGKYIIMPRAGYINGINPSPLWAAGGRKEFYYWVSTNSYNTSYYNSDFNRANRFSDQYYGSSYATSTTARLIGMPIRAVTYGNSSAKQAGTSVSPYLHPDVVQTDSIDSK